MIKKFFFFFLFFLFCFFLPKKKYMELNHLILIDKIEIVCDVNTTLSLTEILPVREDGNVEYHYRNYTYEASTFLEIIPDIEKNSFYFLGVHEFTTNCSNELELKKYFSYS